MVEIRKEIPDDYRRISALNGLAFGQSIEGEIVEKIRDACDETLSLVALDKGEIVGHIFFSPVGLRSDGVEIKAMGLGPMAVSPGHQKRGIGSLLVNAGISSLEKLKYPFIVVLGHPDYYAQFGFERASEYGLLPQWDGIPDEAFMVLFLDRSAMNHCTGVVRYRDEFDSAL